MHIDVLDHGYLRYVEHWGKGDAGLNEAGIIEAARQSTQGSFRGWEDKECPECGGLKTVADGATCSQCEGKGYLPGDARLLKFLFSGKPQHATPFEFCGMVIEVQAPIMVFREWHRHRTQSYNEMSARYAPLPNLNYVPTESRCLLSSTTNKQASAAKGADQLTQAATSKWLRQLETLYLIAEETYQLGLQIGVPKELARLAVPVGRYSKMRASANLRNWLAFMTLRADPAAQWETRQYANALGSIIAQVFPRTWSLFAERLGPNEQRAIQDVLDQFEATNNSP